jgi:hypothetical protein
MQIYPREMCVQPRFARLAVRTDVRYNAVVSAAADFVGIAGDSPWNASPVVLLQDAVEALASEDIEPFSTAAIGDDLVSMRTAIDRLEAEFARRLAQFGHRQGPAAELCSLHGWLRSHFDVTHRDAEQMEQLAEALPQLTGAADAFRRGEISVRNASILARAVAQMGADKLSPAAEPLLTAARECKPMLVSIAVSHARHCVDPDGSLSAAEKAYNSRRVLLSQTFGDMYVLDGQLDPEGGTLLRAALDALSKPAGRDDYRTTTQRRADALIELARRQLQSGELPTTGGQRPHLVLTVPMATLRAEPGSPAGDISRGSTVPAETARRIACDAALTEIGVDAATGEPLSVGRTRRTVPAPMRRALALRDKGCRLPGCDRPVEWTDAHHVLHWADHGETELPNLVLLCRRHHRAVHEGGRRLMIGPGGAVALPPSPRGEGRVPSGRWDPLTSTFR